MMNHENLTTDLPSEDAFYSIFRSIWNKWKPGENHPFSTVNEREATILLIGYLDTEVCNGGFHQWLTNQTGGFTAELVAAIRRVDYPEMLALIERFISDAEIVQAVCWHGIEHPDDDNSMKRLEMLSAEYDAMREKLLDAAICYWHRR